MATRSPEVAQQFVPLKPVERDTLTKLFFSAVDRFDAGAALRFKEGGEWRDLSHREVEARVKRLAAWLDRLGIGRGDRVAILSENRPEWAI
jgi:long-chain acyl-CoA synthetase